MLSKTTTIRRALVLTGGGARGAYQVGVIAGLSELLKPYGITQPFDVVTGTSAGAVNAALYASTMAQGKDPAQELVEIWGSLRNSDVYKTDPMTISTNGLSWLSSLTMGKISSAKKRSLCLLHTDPLRKLLTKTVNFPSIYQAIESGNLKGLAVSAINYDSGMSRTFYMSSDPKVTNWRREKREGISAKITVDHVMASAAIPILFPPICVSGSYYGDGSLRDYSPLSPAIKLGADQIFVIGVRKRTLSTVEASSTIPTPGKILSMILNGILLDAVDLDYERLERINMTLSLIPGSKTEHLRKVNAYLMTPSQYISEIAIEEATKLEKFVQYLLRGLGDFEDTADIVSYILFQSSFTRRLIELGKQDTLNMRQDVLKFFGLPDQPAAKS